MSDELNELQSITHQYRKSLAAYEARTGLAPQSVDSRGSGEERQKFAMMDADLSAVENSMQLRAQLKAAEARLAKLEAEPTLSSRAPQVSQQDEYAARWLKAVASNNPQEMRALSLGSTNAAIPTDMERRIVEKLQQANVLRQIARVSQIDSKRTISVENALPTTALVAEEGTISPADPSFSAAISIVPYKYVTATKMSQEFIEDAIGSGGIGSGLNYVADKCAMSIALKTEEAYTIGSGSGAPQGICVTGGITQGTDLGTGAALTTVTSDQIIDIVHAVAPQYRASPAFRWFISDSLLKTVRKLKDSAGYYVFSPAAAVNQTNVVGLPGTIYGVPYSVGQYVPTSTANGAIYGVVGDFNYFEIFDRTGVTSMLDPYSAAVSHQTTLYLYTRTDSHIMLPSAFAALIG
jgi:HK97 family phage major capsid protein